jgi:hypothetical protein
MGLVSRMTLEQVQPFFLSLEKTGYAGDLCMLVEGLDVATLAFLRARRVQLVPFQSDRLKPGYVRLASWLGKVMSRPHEALYDSLLASSYMHPFCARHYYYLAYLRECGGLYDHVMLTDVRDVIFQADPFAFEINGKLNVFMADRRKTIGTCPHNSASVVRGFGKKMLTNLHDRPVSCAGVILGNPTVLTEHVRRLTMILNDIKPRQTVEQDIHNVALFWKQPEEVQAYENFAGPVLTMANIDPTRLVPDGRIRLRNGDGSLINTLHQYDRHPALARQLVQALT